MGGNCVQYNSRKRRRYDRSALEINRNCCMLHSPPTTLATHFIGPNFVSLDLPRVVAAVAGVAAPAVEAFAPSSSSRAEPDCSLGGGRGGVRGEGGGQPPPLPAPVERGLEGLVGARISASPALGVRLSDSTLAGAGAGADAYSD